MPKSRAGWGLLPLLVVLLHLALPADTRAQGSEPVQPASEWINLGPAGEDYVLRVAVSREWPADRSLAALTASSTWFSPDGGQTWTAGTLPPSQGTSALQSAVFTFAPLYQGQRTLFMTTGQTRGDLWRSTDGGQSWTPVLYIDRRDVVTVAPIFSPAFADDGTAMVVNGGGSLHLTRDGGATWTTLDPAPSQRVQQARFMPDFTSSQTIMAAVVRAPFIDRGYEQQPEQTAAHEDSVGMMISVDGGQTWERRSSGLEVDGVPYRFVNAFAASPAFAEDGTLFAFAWGPLTSVPPNPYTNTRPVALFRSTDRGLSWSAVWHRPAPTEYRSATPPSLRYRGVVRVSSDFLQSGQAQLSLSSTNGAPSGNRCEIVQTTGHDAPWTELGAPSCSNLYRDRERARVGGTPPGHAGNSLVVAADTAASDGTRFMAGRDGIWMLEPSTP